MQRETISSCAARLRRARRIRASHTFPLFHLSAVNSSSSPLKKSGLRPPRLQADVFTRAFIPVHTSPPPPQSLPPQTATLKKKHFSKPGNHRVLQVIHMRDKKQAPLTRPHPAKAADGGLVSKVQHGLQKLCVKLLFQSRLPASLSS